MDTTALDATMDPIRHGAHESGSPDANGPVQLIVAGLDASKCARNAVDWAAAEAARRPHGRLNLVHAYQVRPSGFPSFYPIPDLDDILCRAGQELLDRTAAELRQAYPTLPISTQLAHGDATAALRHASQHAALTVVGTRGVGRVAEIVLGSVALAVASTNPAPVAVIHPNHQGDGDGPIVVGVDGSPNSAAAIAYAFEAAALRHAPLLAVYSSWHNTVVDAAFPGLRMMSEPLVGVRKARRVLFNILSPWRERYPEVRVIQRLARTRPTPTLMRYSREAQLVVVGTRGRNGIAGLVLGSTSHALIIRSICPVIVVRPHSVFATADV